MVSNMTPIKTIIRRFIYDGQEGLTDSELTCLVDYYEDLTVLTKHLDPSFDLFNKELNSRLDSCKSYLNHRNTKEINNDIPSSKTVTPR